MTCLFVLCIFCKREMVSSLALVNTHKDTKRVPRHKLISFQTVQIMIGAMVFILGIVLTSSIYNYTAILEYSGINYWGSFIYISAGCLSVAAQNKHHPCVVKASLGINVFSAITAGMAIHLMGIQLALISMDNPSLYVEYFTMRVTGILLVFTIPQFIISIYISALGCKAACNKDSTVVNVH
uniref:Si:dkey-238j22.1 n=1 Tax=Cyprinus carpio carpio TaxID=630221 RepID=A0A9J8AE65_CYPCA